MRSAGLQLSRVAELGLFLHFLLQACVLQGVPNVVYLSVNQNHIKDFPCLNLVTLHYFVHWPLAHLLLHKARPCCASPISPQTSWLLFMVAISGSATKMVKTHAS